MRFNKKGSLELSIQAIVIVVIAFTVLGLGLGFVKSQLGGLQKTASEASKEEIIFFYSDEVGKRLSPTAGDVLPITISAKSGAAGNYLYKVDVYSCPAPTLEPGTECELYDTRSFFVRVA